MAMAMANATNSKTPTFWTLPIVTTIAPLNEYPKPINTNAQAPQLKTVNGKKRRKRMCAKPQKTALAVRKP